MMIVLVIIAILLAIIVFGESLFVFGSMAIGIIFLILSALIVFYFAAGIIESFGFEAVAVIVVTMFAIFVAYRYTNIINEHGTLGLFFEKQRALSLPEKNAKLLQEKLTIIGNVNQKILDFKKSESDKQQELIRLKFIEIEDLVKEELKSFVSSDKINFDYAKDFAFMYLFVSDYKIASIWVSRNLLEISFRLESDKFIHLQQSPANVARSMKKAVIYKIKLDPSILNI